MKKQNLILLCTIMIFFCSFLFCNKKNENMNTKTEIKSISDKNKDIKLPSKRIDVYYFHGHNRCKTCINAEKYTKLALKKKFQKQMYNKIIFFKDVNYDEKNGKKLADKYEMPFSGVILNVVKNKDESFEILNELFAKVHEGEESTIAYLEKKINKKLSELLN